MVQERKIRNLLGILKDKTSLIKISLLSINSRRSSSVHVAVIRATSHASSASPPPDHRVSAVLSSGQSSRPAASACVAAIMDRLNRTSDAYVALKCLFTIHEIIRRGSHVIKEQLAFYPENGGRNFLNLSMFRDGGGDTEGLELSAWVRWYASVLEHNLMASRIIGTYISSPTPKSNNNIPKNTDRVDSATESNSDPSTIAQIKALISMVEQISRTPDSLQCQRNDLVYEIVNSVGDDYRSTQHQIRVRLSELGDELGELSSDDDVAELGRCTERLEECRGRLRELFVNRKRNDQFWELVRDTKAAAEEEERRRRRRWVVAAAGGGGELTRSRLPSQWLGGNRVQLITVPLLAAA